MSLEVSAILEAVHGREVRILDHWQVPQLPLECGQLLVIMARHLLGLCRRCLILGQSSGGKTCIERSAPFLGPLLRPCRFFERRRGWAGLRVLLH